MAYVLNERIAALRKERGLTQEQLGQMVGVSAQAVSKWEKGSMPDAELLPAIACQLEVTLDALFGMEGGERADMTDLLRRWLIAIPEGRRMDQLCRLIWRILDAIQMPGIEYLPLIVESSGYVPCCDNLDESGVRRWLRRCRIILEEGAVLGIRADDMSFLSIWPEPERGWEPFLESNERYRRLFAALARPHCLELLEYLHARPHPGGNRYTPKVVAQAMGLDAAEAEALMEELVELTLLNSVAVETESGLLKAYQLNENEALVPLLYFARWALTDGSGASNCINRKTPILRGEKWKETEGN